MLSFPTYSSASSKLNLRKVRVTSKGKGSDDMLDDGPGLGNNAPPPTRPSFGRCRMVVAAAIACAVMLLSSFRVEAVLRS